MDLLASAAATILGDDEIGNNSSAPKRKRSDEDSISFPEAKVFRPTSRNLDLKRLGPSLRRWSMLEFFYSTIDSEYFAENEFVACLSLIELGHVEALTRAQWRIVREVMGTEIGRPRRFSRAFLEGERLKLAEYRNSVREFHKLKLLSINESFVPRAPAIGVGNKVMIYDSQSKLVHTGVVLSLISPNDPCKSPNFLVQFDDSSIDSAFFIDEEIKLIDSQSSSTATTAAATSFACNAFGPRLSTNSISRSLSTSSNRPNGIAHEHGEESSDEDEIASRNLFRINSFQSQSSQYGYPNLSQLSQMSQMSQASQQSTFSLANYSISELVEFVNEDSQISDVSFFKLPVEKMAMRAVRCKVDIVLSQCEDDAVAMMSDCIGQLGSEISQLDVLAHSQPKTYKLILRCLKCLLFLQRFGSIDKSGLDADSVLLALAVDVCGGGGGGGGGSGSTEDQHPVQVESLHTILSSLNSLCSVVNAMGVSLSPSA